MPAARTYALGSAVSVTTSDSKNGYWQHSSTTVKSFDWMDGAVQSRVDYTKGGTTFSSFYYYTAGGTLASATINDGRARSVAFTSDMLGQVIRRDESGGNSAGDPHEVWYRFNGKQLGYTGNNGTLATDYPTSIDNRMRVPPSTAGDFRFGVSTGSSHIDFDPALDPINSYAHGSAGGGYTVRAGDTLAGIALGLWGDASLWYKLAEANGLTGASGLIEGRNLVIPHGVQSNHHNASTLKPYDPAEALGDTSPTTPKPQKKGNKCGIFGIVVMVAVGVAVTVLTAGAALAALAPGTFATVGAGISGFIAGSAGLGTMDAAGAVGGIAGSIASQGFGVATGVLDRFDWKGVALAGLAGGISAGLGSLFPATQPLSAAAKAAGHTAKSLGTLSLIGRGAFLGASGSILTQGIGTLVGLQKKFDFANVAAAGLAGGASAGVGKVLNAGSLSDLSARNIGANLATSTAGAIANATVRTLVNGTDFGDNMIAALPDIIGSTIGNMIVGGLTEDRAYEGDGVTQKWEETAPSPSSVSGGEATDDFKLTEQISLDLDLPEILGPLGHVAEFDLGLADLGYRMSDFDLAMDFEDRFGFVGAGFPGDPFDEGRSFGLKDLLEPLFNRGDNRRRSTIERVRDFIPDLTCRILTQGEIAMARPAFGSGIDYDAVQICRGSTMNSIAAIAFFKGHPAITLGNTIYVKSDSKYNRYLDDYSTGNHIFQKLFMHEMAHVFQYRALGGIEPFLMHYRADIRAVGVENLYRYKQGISWYRGATLEAQAAMVGDMREAIVTGNRARTEALIRNLKTAPYPINGYGKN